MMQFLMTEYNLDNWPDLVESLIQSFFQQGLDASDQLHLLLEIIQ